MDQVHEIEKIKIQCEFGQQEVEIEVAKNWWPTNVCSMVVFDL